MPVLATSLFMLTQWTSPILPVLFEFILSVQCNVPQYTSISQRLQSRTTPLLQNTTNKIATVNYFQSQVITTSLTWREKISPIAPGCVKYTDMIRLGKSFVDKSMFIAYLLDSGFKVNLITAPRRWGKTMNIGMFKYFFQAQVDLKNSLLPRDKMSNYDLFVNKQFVHNGDVHTSDKSFIISQYPDFLNSHLGNHFVIHLNFAGVHTEDFETASTGIIETLERVFRSVAYVRTMLTESLLKATTSDFQTRYSNDIRVFNEYTNHNTVGYNITNYSYSLMFLCRVMREQADLRGLRHPIILIDEYDFPITNAFIGKIKWSREDRNALVDFFASFLQNALKANKNYKLAVVTGGLRVVDHKLFTGIDHFKHHNFLNSDEVFFYYGFHEEEIEELFQRYNVTGVEAKHARGFYNGYKGGRNYELSMYNPWDIACFLCDRGLESYWVDTGNFRVFSASYSHYEIYQRQLLSVVTGYPIEISHASSINEEDLEEVSTHLHSRGMESNSDLGSLLRLLYAAGYLTHILTENTSQMIKTDSIYAKVPNTAIKIELSCSLKEDLLNTFYDFMDLYDGKPISQKRQKRYPIFKHTFLDYLRSTSTNTKLLKETCKNMLVNLPNFEHKSSLKAFWLKHLPAITGNEALARLVFDCTVIFESGDLFSFVGIEETFEFLGTTQKIDLVLIFKDKKQYSHAVIIQYKYSSDTSTYKKKKISLNSAQQCLNYTGFFFARQLGGIKSLKCLEIFVQSTKVVLMDNCYINETTYAKYTESLQNLLKSHEDEAKKIKQQQFMLSG